jgi:hypothetical protein
MPLSPRASACLRGSDGAELGGNVLRPQAQPRIDVPRHVECMRARRRDLAIVVGGGQPVWGHPRVVARVDDVVHHAGMIGILCEERRQHRHRLVLRRKARVVTPLGRKQRKRVEGAGIHIVRIVSE